MKADPQRIHQLEFELGFRDDPPPFQFTDKPGTVIQYAPPMQEDGPKGLIQTRSPYTQHVSSKAQVWSKRVNDQ